MLKLFRNKKAQSTAEYAILIGIVVAAVIGMQTWVSRTIKARIYDAATKGNAIATNIGLGFPAWLNTNQFEPYVPGERRTVRTSPTREYMDPVSGLLVINIETGGEITNQIGNQVYNATLP